MFMLRLTRYIKPYSLLIVIAVALLFVQAMADLSLPDYMSRIVNNGVQQGGIDSSVAVAVRQSTMDKLILFMNADEQALVLGNYTFIDASSSNYDQYTRDYPALANEPIYVLNAVDGATTEALTPIMGRAFTAVSSIEQIMADPSQAFATAERSGMSLLTSLPAGTDIFAVIRMLPTSSREQMINGMDERFASMGSSMVVQAAAGAVKNEYAALGMDTAAIQNNYIIRMGLIMLGMSLVSGGATVAVGYLAAKVAAGLARDLRRDVFKKVENFSHAEFDKFSTASLITRTTNDVNQVQTVVALMIRMVIYAPIMGVGGSLRALSQNTSMSYIIVIAVLVLLGMIITIFSIALPRFKVVQDLVDRLNLVMRENLSGIMVIRAFNTQRFEEKRFDKANRDLSNTNLFVNRVVSLLMPAMTLIMNAVSVAIVWVGAHQIAASQMQVGDMMAFLQYATQIVMSFLMMSMMFIMLPRASVSGGRIADVLETEPSITDPENPLPFRTPIRGEIEFRNVSFRYPGAEEDVLRNIDFTAKPGQVTAFIGSTGSGKSTVVNLIPRFYDVTQGAILIDGIDVRSVRQHDLRNRIGYIPQQASLFSGTIESNLRYADETVSAEALTLATNIAQASEFIAAKPDGMATEIAQGGSNVSGGQKQRLSIARALVKKPPIYIFDDSFSAVDYKTDVALRRALKEHTGDSTVLIVAQRISTIKNAEQIIVLDQGRIVGRGTHAELMETCETYREIALSQLREEELA
jgi:ATP-binding cassette, subfamily B, multidrug efflux pump